MFWIILIGIFINVKMNTLEIDIDDLPNYLAEGIEKYLEENHPERNLTDLIVHLNIFRRLPSDIRSKIGASYGPEIGRLVSRQSKLMSDPAFHIKRCNEPLTMGEIRQALRNQTEFPIIGITLPLFAGVVSNTEMVIFETPISRASYLEGVEFRFIPSTWRAQLQIIEDKSKYSDKSPIQAAFLTIDLLAEFKIRSKRASCITDLRMVNRIIVNKYNLLFNEKKVDEFITSVLDREGRYKYFVDRLFINAMIIGRIDMLGKSLMIDFTIPREENVERVDDLVYAIKDGVKKLTGARDDPNEAFALIL